MAEQLKNVYDRAYVTSVGKAIFKHDDIFDHEGFVNFVFNCDWDHLELKERMARIREGIYEYLKLPFQKSCKVLMRSGEDFGSYAGMLFPDFIEKYGLDHWSESMEALEVLTIYSSSEFAIRPFIIKDQDLAFKQLLKWSNSSNEHVRRLASEGCRPRLPWSFALKKLKADPAPIIPILENLKEDSSLYVRKSVANNLNDISKDHPELVLKLAKKWLKNKHPHTLWIVKHGLRSLLKAGESKALSFFGYGDESCVTNVSFQVHTPLLFLNDSLEILADFEIKKDCKVRIEYALYFRHKSGKFGKKVFKISEQELVAGEYEVDRLHSFKPLTTRTYHEGIHGVELIINGKSFGKKAFIFLNKKSPYYVYLLHTKRNTMYCGVTTDMNRRYLEHCGILKGGAKFTKAQAPSSFLYLEKAKDRSSAQSREYQIKKLSRKEKEKLIGHDLYSCGS